MKHQSREEREREREAKRERSRERESSREREEIIKQIFKIDKIRQRRWNCSRELIVAKVSVKMRRGVD